MSVMKFCCLLLLSFAVFLPCQGQEEGRFERQGMRFMFYNVENYFDTKEDSLTDDKDFTPEGFKHWTFDKYKAKQQNIAKVTMAVGEWEIPELVGLCEVENRKVLKDLLKWTPLSKFPYRIIHQESPDYRGIDVALLYDHTAFEPIDTVFKPINFPFKETSKTREILYVSGVTNQEDTLHLFINHWPSRWGGKEATDPKRKYVAKVLRGMVDSLFRIDPNAKILIGGDFNDNPNNTSIADVLDAQPDKPPYEEPGLVNLMYSKKTEEGKGTLKYQYDWDLFDQIMVSTALLNNNAGHQTSPDDAHIFRKEWLLTEDQKYTGQKLFRTYVGPRYKGGYSDHLPVYLDLKLNNIKGSAN